MSARRALMALLAGAVALAACGRKDEPERPERPAETEAPALGREQDDDPLLRPLPPDATPGPRLEERVDETLDD